MAVEGEGYLPAQLPPSTGRSVISNSGLAPETSYKKAQERAMAEQAQSSACSYRKFKRVRLCGEPMLISGKELESVGNEDSREVTAALTCRAGEEGTDFISSQPQLQPRSTKPSLQRLAHFPLMRLPPEIRLEIYRACLTRPFNICLFRNEPELRVASPDIMPLLGARTSGESEIESAMSVGETPGSPPDRDFQDPPASPIGPQSPLSSDGVPSLRERDDHSTGQSLASNETDAQDMPWTMAAADVSLEPDLTDDTRTLRKRPQDLDPLHINLLRTNKFIYEEARSILYSENHFTISLDTASTTLASLHQRSRRLIKHVELEIPAYNEILERFQETVRLSLRYCWGLQTFIIHMPPAPSPQWQAGAKETGSVHANGFDILRWLPRQCEVVLKGIASPQIEAVVSKNAKLAQTLDELAYARRQLISHDGERCR